MEQNILIILFWENKGEKYIMKNILKRTTSLLLAIIMCLSIGVPAFAEEISGEEFSETTELTVRAGDVDFNGKVTASDARTILRVAAQLEIISDTAKSAADYDSDGSITALDARYTMREAAGLDPFKEPETTTKAPETTTKAPETTTKAPATTVLTPENRKYTLETNSLFSTSYCTYAVLYDYDNDKILYQKNMHSTCYPASTTKVLTACVASEYLSADYVLTVGNEQYSVASNTSKAGLYIGQRIKFKEMLKCLLLPSGCDAAYTIAVETARVASGNKNMSASKAISYFVDMMNKYAKKLGMNDSHFANPDGYPNSNHYTSAYDMTKLTVKAYSIKIIRDTVCMTSATAYFESGGAVTYTNTNETINPYSSRYYPYMVGVKTGYHSAAGYCLVTVAKKYIERTGKTKTFVAVVFNCYSKDGRYQDLKNLYNTAFSYFWRQP